MNETGQKKIAMINSMAGYGRCSITAAIPVLSALKVQVLPGAHGYFVKSYRLSKLLL